MIIGGLGDRSVVSSCSYEARTFGVHSAMPMSQARRLCPQAVIIGGDMHEYSRYSALVSQVVNDAAPLVEKASIDEFYLDISGMDRFCANPTNCLNRPLVNLFFTNPLYIEGNREAILEAEVKLAINFERNGTPLAS